METVEGVCPHCNHKIIIPKSCILYKCVCGEFYNITIIKNGCKPTEKPIRATERAKNSTNEESF